MAEGSQRYLAYAKETTAGIPITSALQKLRNTGGSGIANERTSITSNEIRDDRAIVVSRLGNNQPNLNIPMEFSYGSYEDFMAAALGHNTTWAAVAYTAAAGSIVGTVVVDEDEKTMVLTSLSWHTLGLRVGDKVTFSGFIVSTGANNGTYVVTYMSTTATDNDTITLGDAVGLVDETGATGTVTCAQATAITDITCGVVDTSFTIEEGFTDLTVPQYQYIAGGYVSSWNMSIQPDAVVTGGFDLQGMVYGALSATKLVTGGATDISNVNNIFDTYTGVMYIDGLTETCIVTGLDFTLDNALNRRYSLMDKDACSVGQGRTNVTGTINAFFDSPTMSALFNEETEFKMSIRLEDLDGNSYVIGFPKVKLTSDGKDVSENDVTQTLNFQALGGDDDTTMYIRKQATA